MEFDEGIAELERALGYEEASTVETEETREQLVLKEKFFEELVEKLNPKQNKIEIRAITQKQIDLISSILLNKDYKA